MLVVAVSTASALAAEPGGGDGSGEGADAPKNEMPRREPEKKGFCEHLFNALGAFPHGLG
jgi:hypothetical protein